MRNRIATALPVLLSALALAADPPQLEIKKQVEPEWEPTITAFFVDAVKVQMIIDDSGKPFELDAAGPIPDNVVTALSGWRFRTTRPFRTSVVVPIHRKFGPRAEMELRRSNSGQPGDPVLKIAAADKLDAAEVAGLETKILSADTSTPDRIDGETALLVRYTRDAAPEDGKAVERRVALIAKLVETDPAAPILATAFATLNGDGAPLGSSAGYAQIRQTWLKRLDPKTADAGVIRAAANFLEIRDPETVEHLLQTRINKGEGFEVWLGDLWARAALGVTALDPLSGRGVRAASEIPTAGFAAHARASLMVSKDARILFSAMSSIQRDGTSLASKGQLPDGFPALCASVLAKVKALDAGARYSCESASASLTPETMTGQAVQSAKLISKIVPHYPQEARAQGVRGTVRMHAMIAADGKVKDLEFLSGPVMLYWAAREAVQHWEYSPTLLNGKPVEVSTIVDVHFTLGH